MNAIAGHARNVLKEVVLMHHDTFNKKRMLKIRNRLHYVVKMFKFIAFICLWSNTIEASNKKRNSHNLK